MLDESEILPRSFFPPCRGGSKLLLEKYHLPPSSSSSSPHTHPAFRGLCVCDVRTNEFNRNAFPSFRRSNAKRSSGPPPSFATSKLWKSLVGSGLDWRDLRRNLIRGDDKRRKYRPKFPIPFGRGKKFSALFEGFLELAPVKPRVALPSLFSLIITWFLSSWFMHLHGGERGGISERSDFWI